MATNKNITMKQFNGVDYDALYPKTIASQIDDVYSKDEMSNLFLPKAGGSMGGILDMNGNRITNLASPVANSDPATKEYVDGSQSVTKKLFYSNDSLTLTNDGMKIPINATIDDLTNCSALTYSGIFTVYSNSMTYFNYGNDEGNGVFLVLPYNGENIEASLFVLLNSYVVLNNPNNITRVQSIGYNSYVILTKDNTGIYTFVKTSNVSDRLVIRNFKIYGIFI